MYKFICATEVLDLASGRVIFLSGPETSHMLTYLSWCAGGGVTLPADIPDPVPMTKESKCSEVNAYCAAMFTKGFVYGGATFQACAESQRRIAARVTYALANKIDAVAFPWVSPHSDGWWDINNMVLASTQTVDGFLAFAKAFGDYCSACEKCKRDHKNAITPLNCATYDYTTGWPVNQ